MNLTVRLRHVDSTPELRQSPEHRIAVALGRLAGAIRTVDLSVADVNGPRGGADKQCRLRVRGRGFGAIVVEDLGADVLATVSHAAERAQRTIVRALARRRGFCPAFAR